MKESVARTGPLGLEGLGEPDPQDRSRVSPHTGLCRLSPQTHSELAAWTLHLVMSGPCWPLITSTVSHQASTRLSPLERHLWVAAVPASPSSGSK